MVTETIQQLLVLQDRNTHVNRLQSEIKRLPLEVTKLNKLIDEEQSEVRSKKADIQQLEVAKKQLELDVQTAEETVAKYKNQQIQVKKNDEYKALTLQIEQTDEKIGELETQELELMEQIDAENQVLKTIEEEVGKRVKYQEALIAECHEKLKNLESQLSDAKSAYSEQVGKMEEKDVQLFVLLTEQVKRAPYVASISGQNCGGCHMRTSNDILKRAKMGQIARCDQCGRVVYFDS